MNNIFPCRVHLLICYASILVHIVNKKTSLPIERSFREEWREWDLNPRPTAYESAALPTELPRQECQNFNANRMICQQNRSKIAQKPNPFSFREKYRPCPTTMWSSTSISSNLPACTSARVSAISSGLGLGSPLGWL